MAATPEDLNIQRNLNKLLEDENEILRRRVRLQTDSLESSTSLVESLKEILNVRTKTSTFEQNLLKLNKDINKAITSQTSELNNSKEIQKQIAKNTKLINTSTLYQNSLYRTANQTISKSAEMIQKLKDKQNDLNEKIDEEIRLINSGEKNNKRRLVSLQRRLVTNQDLVSQELEQLNYSEKLLYIAKLNTEELKIQNKEQKNQAAILERIETSMGVAGEITKTISKIPGIGDSAAKALSRVNSEITKTAKSAKDVPTPLKTSWMLIKEIGNEVLTKLKDPIVLTGIALAAVAKTFEFLLNAALDFSKRTATIAKDMGISSSEAQIINDEFSRMATVSKDILVTQTSLLKALSDINEQFSTSAFLSEKILKGQIDLTERLGLTGEEAAIFTELSMKTGKTQEDIVNSIGKQNKGILSNKKVIQAVAKVNGELYAQYRGTPGEIAKAVIQTQKLGMSLKDAKQISETLLDFQSSIEAEMEAELLTGRQLNLERARYLALTGDSAGAVEELMANLGIEGDRMNQLMDMNIIQRKALAKSLGMSSDELVDMVRTQETLASLSASEKKSYDEAIVAARKKGEFDRAAALERQMNQGKEFKLAEQQLDAQTRFNKAVEKLKSLLTAVVEGPLGKMIDGIVSVTELIAKIPGAGRLMAVAGTIGTVLAGGYLVKALTRGSSEKNAMYTRPVTGLESTDFDRQPEGDVVYDKKSRKYRDKGGTGKPIRKPRPGMPRSGGASRWSKLGGGLTKYGSKLAKFRGLAKGLGPGLIAAGVGMGADYLAESQFEKSMELEKQGQLEQAKKAKNLGIGADITGSALGGAGLGAGLAAGLTYAGVGLSSTGIGALVGIPLLAAAAYTAHKHGLFGGKQSTADDFISRPGQPIQKFRKDDIIVGGTDPFGTAGNSNDTLTKEMSEIKNILSQILNKEGAVYIDGAKVGKSIVLADSRLG